MLILTFLLACAHESVEQPKPVEAPPATPPAQPLVLGEADANGNPTVLIAPTSTDDPKALYEGCKARVEGEEKDGECTKDEDCAPTGCSKEVCAPKSANVTTTCDVQPCFRVLDTCGCNAGHCSWTLKATG